jgi:hypothetical protein
MRIAIIRKIENETARKKEEKKTKTKLISASSHSFIYPPVRTKRLDAVLDDFPFSLSLPPLSSLPFPLPPSYCSLLPDESSFEPKRVVTIVDTHTRLE